MALVESSLQASYWSTAVLEDIERLLETIASPELSRAFSDFDRTPRREKWEARRRFASVESLRREGVPFFPGSRVCLRSFEDPANPSYVYDFDPSVVGRAGDTETVCFSLGIIFCVSWGRTTTISELEAAPSDIVPSAISEDRRRVPGGASAAETRQSLLDITHFCRSDAFRHVLRELYDLDGPGRTAFVRDVLLDRDELASRGVILPEDMVLQRSAFADRRPTLFCVSKPLSVGGAKVTITFDASGTS